MKKIIISSIIAAASAGIMTSCADMMSPESGAYLYDEDLNLKNPNDSLYSIAGLMTKVQQLGERYVLFGELRGDLVNVAPTADVELQEISNFSPQSEQTYLRRTDFYAVINHCNWIINKINSNTPDETDKVLAEEYSAAVLYRAWTYLQMGLAYGSVKWVTEPVLNLDDSEKEYPVIELDQLVDKLIEEVRPLANDLRPNYGSIDSKDARKFFIVPSALLADLYLYAGRYNEAAQMYWYTINEYRLPLADNCISFQSGNSQRLSLGAFNFRFNYSSEALTEIPYSSSAKDFHPNLINLTINDKPALLPAEWWIDEMAEATYYFGTKNYVAGTFSEVEEGGDLRGAARLGDGSWTNGGSVGLWRNATGSESTMMISKFFNNGTTFQGAVTENTTLGTAIGVTGITLAGNAQLYLKYAEAVNRLGKPSLAYAVIRYGLNSATLADETRVNPDELESGEEWLNWNETSFDNNIGTAAHGRGYGVSYPEATAENMPADLTADELMLWVEERIADELAAETSFEGNRFFDLVRISRHRADNSWFAGKVARRFNDPAAAAAKLTDRNNWFIR